MTPTMKSYRAKRKLPACLLKFPKRTEAKKLSTAQYVERFCELNGLKRG